MTRELPPNCRDLVCAQQGVVSRSQALEAGVGPATVAGRLRDGHWRRLHRGVYATFTGEPSREAELWAALRRAGPAAILSHYTAAELSQLVTRRDPLIHVTVPRDQHLRPIPGIAVHRSARIEAARHPSLLPPRTRIEETALDLAGAAASLDDALAWLARACGSRLTTAGRLRAALDGRTRIRWRRELAAALSDIADGVNSVLELRYLRRVERRHGLPPARRQVRITQGRRTGYRDALYEQFGVVVETDGQIAHPLAARWRDQHRDNAAAAGGLITLRYGWADVTQRPCRVAAEVAAVLRLRGWRESPRPCSPICPLRHTA
jgi:very-short-patch-repair endonuclease/predicted transcriptional regulator of viral defense system